MNKRTSGLCKHGKDLCAVCAKAQFDEEMRQLKASAKVETEKIWTKLVRREAEAIRQR